MSARACVWQVDSGIDIHLLGSQIFAEGFTSTNLLTIRPSSFCGITSCGVKLLSNIVTLRAGVGNPSCALAVGPMCDLVDFV